MDFFKQLVCEILRQEHLLNEAEGILSSAPEGSLTIRVRKTKTDYYLNVDEGRGPKRKRKQTNISKNKPLILQLTEKLIQQKIFLRSKHNLIYLKKLRQQYSSTNLSSIATLLTPSYQQVIELRKQALLRQFYEVDYPRAPFDKDSHVHETDCGELVRSKSEQIILNSLFAYNILTHYEEQFLYTVTVPGINRVFPDFTIIFPDGKRILWEHLGRLDDPGYCARTAAKLNLYQQNGYVIGDNLILTMDDANGNLSSSLVLQAIEQHILPKIKEVEIQF